MCMYECLWMKNKIILDAKKCRGKILSASQRTEEEGKKMKMKNKNIEKEIPSYER